ncbi:F-box/LRR-repeat protein At3g58900-like [Herrania umbratica]|uniref:F-box/LRR-repeat protein At3g58900-like n=1 Tax=Herrania umbratica TaxID=108875 RepID=A0A6J1ALC6_9ROSI|nr:F-box/LRR-repeat protein At3g58900-like [Herrania umbratica]
MATDALPLSPIRQMSLERQDDSQGEDRISNLPEDVLVHSLSFLPTKEAIRTSVLSTRWQNLWMSLPNLTFTDLSYLHRNQDRVPEVRASFMKLVDRSIHHRKACIRKLSLSLQKEVDVFRLNSWLCAAIRHKTQNLDLFLIEQEYVILPHCLFTAESLISLVLRMECTLRAPTPVCFSSLKFLELSHVKFKDVQTCQELFSGCLVLEELVLKECNWKNISDINIDIPPLKKFSLSNYTSQQVKRVNCKIKINTANLSHLSCQNFLRVQLVPYNPLPALESAQVDIFGVTNRGEDGRRAVQLLAGLKNANSLYVTNDSLLVLNCAENPEADLPTFHYLTQLYVRPTCCLPDVGTVGAVMYLLQKAPNLEFLSIASEFQGQDLDWFFQTLPCFTSRLKSFSIMYFEGTAASIQLLKYLCQHAPVLKKIYLFSSYELTEEIKDQVLQVLGDSKRVKIRFYS